MKKLIYILPLFIFATACSNRAVKDKLVMIDSLVVQELYDSAYNVLAKIDTTLLTDQDSKAHYYLLRKHLGYLTPHRDSTNMLDSIVIPYYTSTDNKEKLADAYYYKAYGEIISGKKKEATTDYKRAEELANQTDDPRLQFKVAESMAYINAVTMNHLLQCEYIRKMIKLAKSIDNKDWLVHSYLDMAYAHSELGNKDSLVYYCKKAEELKDFANPKDRQALLTDIAYIYKYSQPEIAKKYYEEALAIRERSIILEHLANIYYDEGNKEKAYETWQRALAIDDNNPKDLIIHNLLDYDLEHGRTDEVCKRVNEIIAIKDSIINSVKNDTIRNLQLNFDHEVEMNTANEKLIRWQRALGIIALFAFLLIIYILWRKHKTKLQRLEHEIVAKDYIRKVLDLEVKAAKTEAQLSAIQSENEENKQEIQRLETMKSELEEESKRLLGKEVQKIRRGIQLYEQLAKSEKVNTWNNTDYEAIVSFFEASNPKATKEIQKKYGHLTTRNMLYLILVDMGKSNDEIGEIMSLDKSSIRSLTYRLRKQIKEPQ